MMDKLSRRLGVMHSSTKIVLAPHYDTRDVSVITDIPYIILYGSLMT